MPPRRRSATTPSFRRPSITGLKKSVTFSGANDAFICRGKSLECSRKQHADATTARLHSLDLQLEAREWNIEQLQATLEVNTRESTQFEKQDPRKAGACFICLFGIDPAAVIEFERELRNFTIRIDPFEPATALAAQLARAELAFESAEKAELEVRYRAEMEVLEAAIALQAAAEGDGGAQTLSAAAAAASAAASAAAAAAAAARPPAPPPPASAAAAKAQADGSVRHHARTSLPDAQAMLQLAVSKRNQLEEHHDEAHAPEVHLKDDALPFLEKHPTGLARTGGSLLGDDVLHCDLVEIVEQLPDEVQLLERQVAAEAAAAALREGESSHGGRLSTHMLARERDPSVRRAKGSSMLVSLLKSGAGSSGTLAEGARPTRTSGGSASGAGSPPTYPRSSLAKSPSLAMAAMAAAQRAEAEGAAQPAEGGGGSSREPRDAPAK